MTFRKIRKVCGVAIVACVVLCAGALGYAKMAIQQGLDEWRATAQEAHPFAGDDVAALIAYVQSDSHTLHDRDYVVWALGQARDKRALPVLEAFVTGEKCDHSKFLCQGELTKAIKLLRDPINILGIRTPVASNQAISSWFGLFEPRKTRNPANSRFR